MSFTKFILPIIMQFFSSRNSDTGMSSQALFLKAVTVTVKKEISGLILKIAFGLVATGVLIYSLVMLGQYVHTFLLLYNDGVLFSVLFFSLISIICVFAVVKLFYQKETAKDPFEAFSLTGNSGFSLEKIYSNFMTGLHTSLEQNEAEQSASTKKNEADNYIYPDTAH